MAIEIKSIPILKKKVAVKFNRKADAAVSKKTPRINFEKQKSITTNILAKAKI